jgi:hypothetical protein
MTDNEAIEAIARAICSPSGDCRFPDCGWGMFGGPRSWLCKIARARGYGEIECAFSVLA